MEKRYNLSNLQAKFTDYLIAENISPITLKNYRSDIKHFFNWIAKSNRDQEMTSITSLEIIIEYKTYLIDDQTPQKTINRRLSAIRKFCSFCISQRWIEENHAKKVMNHTTSPRLPPFAQGFGVAKRGASTTSNDAIEEQEAKAEILSSLRSSRMTTGLPTLRQGFGVAGTSTSSNDILAEFKTEFPNDFDNLHDYFEIINYPQSQGK